MNKFEKVSCDHQQMTLAGGDYPRGGGIQEGAGIPGGTLPIP